MVIKMKDDFESIVYSEDMIKQRVAELGEIITSEYRNKSPLLIGILKGSFVFLADLARKIDISCEIRFIEASSYGLEASSSGTVGISKPPHFDIRGRHVIIVEDILDTGVTLKAIRELIYKMEPASVKICVLLDKTSSRQVDLNADYTGFDCPDAFVVGYGLDYAERYRNLPYVASLKPEIYS